MVASEPGVLNQCQVNPWILKLKPLGEKVAQMLGVQLVVTAMFDFDFHGIHGHMPP